MEISLDSIHALALIELFARIVEQLKAFNPLLLGVR